MPQPRPLIFVNYRGSDAIWATEYVYSRLAEAFGADAVFKAGNTLRAGDVYPPILEEQAVRCPLMLVCMGSSWLTAADEDGARRLDSPDDWVRREISLALRNNNRVVPLLFGNHGEVKIPKYEDLPEDLRSLIWHQARRLAPGGGLDLTMPALLDELATLVPELGALRAKRTQGADTETSRETPSTVFNIGRVGGDVIGRDKNVDRRS